MSSPIALCDVLPQDMVLSGLEASTKKQLLEDLSAKAGEKFGLEGHAIFDVLWEREQLGTTGVGEGIAIPHGRVAGIDRVQGLFASLTAPVGFESTDGKPVDLVFMLLSPADAGADHLHALSIISRLLREKTTTEALRKAKDSKSMAAILFSASKKTAA